MQFKTTMEVNTIWSYVESKQKQAQKWWEQIRGCQRQGVGMGGMSEDSQKKESSSYKMNRSWEM